LTFKEVGVLAKMRKGTSGASALLMFAAILALGPRDPARAASALSRFDDQGTFLISLAGTPLGTEKFSIQASGDELVAQADIHMKSLQSQTPIEFESFPKLVLDSHLDPQTYSWHINGPESYEINVDFRTSPAQSRLRVKGKKGEDLRTFKLPRDVIILDNNVIHGYQLLLDRFYMSSKHKQTFSGYIPQDALPGVLTLQDVGPETVAWHGASTTLEHFVLLADNARLDLWVDKHHRLQRLYDASTAMEAIRE
jgi:hypothetical protein